MPTLTVATFNIQHCTGRDGITSSIRTAEVIRSIEPDVIALQEIDVGWPRSGHEDQVASLAAATGLILNFYPTIERPEGGTYGLALAAREPLETHFEELPSVEGSEPRGVITATLGDLRLVATHLARNGRARSLQIRRIAELVSGGGPVVLAGDLNTTREELGPLGSAGLDLGPPVPTLSLPLSRRQIDYIGAGGGAALRSVHSVRSRVSDHRPLVATVEY